MEKCAIFSANSQKKALAQAASHWKSAIFRSFSREAAGGCLGRGFFEGSHGVSRGFSGGGTRGRVFGAGRDFRGGSGFFCEGAVRLFVEDSSGRKRGAFPGGVGFSGFSLRGRRRAFLRRFPAAGRRQCFSVFRCAGGSRRRFSDFFSAGAPSGFSWKIPAGGGRHSRARILRGSSVCGRNFPVGDFKRKKPFSKVFQNPLTNFPGCDKIKNAVRCALSSADRVLGYEPIGQRFESSRARQNRQSICFAGFILLLSTTERSSGFGKQERIVKRFFHGLSARFLTVFFASRRL